MINYIMHLWTNVWIAVGLYWCPLAFCAVGYTLRTAKNYMTDRKLREEAALSNDGLNKKYYVPTDRIGDLIGRAFITIMPVANLWAAMFDLAPDFFESFFKWCAKVLNQPLVPPKK